MPLNTPLGTVRYFYLGSADVERDLAYYREVLGAALVFDFSKFGTRVAAVELLEGGPTLLIAGHRPAPSLMPVVAVEDLEATIADLESRGWTSEGGRFEIPNGPCITFHDPSGNPWALFQNVRPRALEDSYRD